MTLIQSNRKILIHIFKICSSSTVGEDLQDFSSKQSSDSSTSELKAEIRDVINKVEDAIENSDSLGVCNANLNALSHSVRYFLKIMINFNQS